MKSRIIGIDFDGTCVTHEFPKVGRNIDAAPVLRKLIQNGHRLILFTMRSDITNPTSTDKDIIPKSGTYLSDAIEWFNINEIPLFGINENPEQKSWTTSPKPYCNLYIDDAALGCPLIRDEGLSSRPFVDWFAVNAFLILHGYY